MNKKVQKNILLIYIITFVISLIGATYAYFTVIKVSSTSPEAEIKSATTEIISFSIANDLNIKANYSNFQEGMDSLVSETSAKAYMKCSSDSRVVKHTYNLRIDISENDFTYTTAEENVELILLVTDPNGNPITSIEGLDYVSSQNGFDITTKTGNYYIVKEYPLETASEITHEWKVSVMFVNLDAIQDENHNKTLNAHLIMERSENDAR